MNLIVKPPPVPANAAAAAFRKSLKGKKYRPYRSPMDDMYYGLTAPPWQRACYYGLPWSYTNPETGETRSVSPSGPLSRAGARTAAVGAKGSAKSFVGGFGVIDLVQMYPGCKIGLAANSYTQAFESGAEKVVEIADNMGIEIEYRDQMVLDNKKHRFVYYFPEFGSALCIRSFDAIKMIEGSEWDGFWFEEIQDCAQQHVTTAMSRCRRGKIPDPWFFAAGMPDDEFAWMYQFFPNANFDLFEPPLIENAHNVPGYIDLLNTIYSGQDAKRYIDGERIGLFRSKVFNNFRHGIHVAGKASERLSIYDEYLPLYVVIDFNVAPFCVSIWQMKRWRPDFADGMEERQIMMQVDEIEKWNSNSQEIADEILERYKDHRGGGVTFGDATGNARKTSGLGKTDWDIIAATLTKIPNMVVRRGLLASYKDGKPAFSNPNVRDTVADANWLLLGSDGVPKCAFLPESKFVSGGCWKSVAMQGYKADGTIDKSNDSKPGIDVQRTHFGDGFRYLAHFARNSLMPLAVDVSTIRARTKSRMGFQLP